MQPDRVADIRRAVLDTLDKEETCRRCGSYLSRNGSCSNHECGL